MIYPQRDNRRRQKKIAFTSSIIIVVVLICIFLNLWKPQFFTPVVQVAGRPVMEAKGGVLGGINSIFHYLHTHQSLVTENQDLQQRMMLFQAVETERDYYKNQTNELLGLREKEGTTTTKIVLSKIISKPGFSPYDTMIIDSGASQGIKKGDKVLADADTALGEVLEVTRSTATVTLYSSPERETPVLIGSSSIQASSFGKGGGNFEIKLPKNTEIKEGDIVTLASTTSKILGTIQLITKNPSDSFERALFKNVAEVNSLTFVIVEKQ